MLSTAARQIARSTLIFQAEFLTQNAYRVPVQFHPYVFQNVQKLDLQKRGLKSLGLAEMTVLTGLLKTL